MIKFLKENILWFIFTLIFTALFLVNILVSDIDSISWLNNIIKSPFVLVAGATILVGVYKTFIYIVGFFECEHAFQSVSIFLIIAISLIMAFQML